MVTAKTFKILFLVLFLHILSNTTYSQGKINESKNELNNGGRTNDSQNSGSSNYNSTPDDDNDSENSLLAEIIGKIFLAITYHSLIGDYELEDHLHNQISEYPYPYYDDYVGNYEYLELGEYPDQSLRADVENKFLLSNNIYSNHF